MNQTIWVGAVAYDPKVVTIWEGMRRYFHEEGATHAWPVACRSQRGLIPFNPAPAGGRVEPRP